MTLSLHEHFKTFAHYNAWANTRLYEACAELSEADYLLTRPSFFGSIHSTLNHILVGDRAWMARFTGGTTAITALNQELYADFAGLRVARLAEDALIINYIESLNDDSMLSWLEYQNMAGEDQADEISILLSHFFNGIAVLERETDFQVVPASRFCQGYYGLFVPSVFVCEL